MGTLLYVQQVNETKEKTFDINLKAYKQLEFGKLWGGISYRRSLDGAEYRKGGSTEVQKNYNTSLQ